MRRLWHWAKHNKLIILGGVLMIAETAVQMGVPLPGSEAIPIEWRGLFYASIAGVGWAVRMYAMRSQRRARDSDASE